MILTPDCGCVWSVTSPLISPPHGRESRTLPSPVGTCGHPSEPQSRWTVYTSETPSPCSTTFWGAGSKITPRRWRWITRDVRLQPTNIRITGYDILFILFILFIFVNKTTKMVVFLSPSLPSLISMLNYSYPTSNNAGPLALGLSINRKS